MKYIKVNTVELVSALKLSECRLFKDSILKKEFKNYLNTVFKDKDRIYLPFEQSEVKVPKEIKNYLSSKDLKVVDYKAGIAENKTGKLAKIGKALSRDDEGKRLLDLFNTSRSGAKKDNLMIVISRHPYDLIGMSTGRGWTSCMNLYEGGYEYVHKAIENGTLVAYIIDSLDPNIEKPVCRLLLKQFINVENEKDVILYPEEEIYGAKIKGFKKRIIEWLKTFQTFEGTYRLNPNVHDDGDEIDKGNRLIGFGDKKSDSIKMRKLYYKHFPDDTDAKNPKEVDEIRELYFRKHPDDEQAKDDENDEIRYEYYRKHKDDKQAKYDTESYIRKMYYRRHPEETDAIL